MVAGSRRRDRRGHQLKRLILKRGWYQDERTIGELYTSAGEFLAYTMEPGRLDTDSPRVPSGFYFLKRHGWAPDTRLRFKKTWALVGRSVVHQAGDAGYRDGVRTAVVFHRGVRDEHTLACPLLGTLIDRSRDELALAGGEEAMARLRDFLGEADASLVIEG